MSASSRLIIFTRYPELGKAKTRLIPGLGLEAATHMHRQMVEHCAREVRQVRVVYDLDVEVQFTGGTVALMRAWLGADFSYRVQGEGDLGDRLSPACQTAFAEGAQSVMVMGTDCPGLNVLGLVAAWQELQWHDVVLGPTLDGGYYLMGLRKFVPELFQGITWSTANVCSETVAIARQLQLSTQFLPKLGDVDHPEDLIHWQQATAKISVIIPTLNEANGIAQTLMRLKSAQYTEIILVDGGSQDQTRGVAQAFAGELDLLQVLSSPPGRARQMNQGAQAATGEILLFLHGDTQLPDRFDLWVRQVFATTSCLAGAFALKIDAQLPGLRLIEWLVNWRSRILHMPYGDQAQFIQAQAFHELGGFPDQALMEDYELMRRLKRQGLPIAIIPVAVTTSGRRWQTLGIIRTTLINQIIVLAYRLGLSPTRLAQWYRQQKP